MSTGDITTTVTSDHRITVSNSLIAADVVQLARSPPNPSRLSALLSAALRQPSAASLLTLFIPLLPSLNPDDIPSILSSLISCDRCELAPRLDLLPPLVSLALRSNHYVAARNTLHEILAINWPNSLVIKITSLLREIPPPLGRPLITEFLEKIFCGMKKSMDIQDLPSCIYQLLLLASKGSHRRDVMAGILKFFRDGVKGPPAVVRQVEGTVLMHVNFAVKQDPSLAQEVLAIVRADLSSINDFAVATLLSVARVRRFNEAAIGAIKMAVIASRRDYMISREHEWLPTTLTDECFETAKHVEKALLKTVNESICGREHVVPSIVEVGFGLLEHIDGKCAGLESSSDGLMTVEDLGVQVLKNLFEAHEMARNEIIEQCKSRVLSSKPQTSIHIIKLLGHLAQRYPYPMLEHVARLKDLLDYFTFMHAKTSIALLNALLPLIKFSRDLQHYMILVLRKAMFKKEEMVRQAAITATIDLILAESRSSRSNFESLQESSSQASCSQQGEIPSWYGRGLFLELNGLLRRCLSQQANMKEILYEGLMKLVMLDPSCAPHVLDFLWRHFCNFYDEDQKLPFHLDACVKLEDGIACVVEPLDCLLSSVSWILLQLQCKSDRPVENSWSCFGFSLSQDIEGRRKSSRELFSNALCKIRKVTRFHTLEGGLLKSQHSDPQLLYEDKAAFHSIILAGIIEAYVNMVALELENASDKDKDVLLNEILEFIDSHDSLEKVMTTVKQRTGSRKGSSKTKANMEGMSDKNDNERKESPQTSLPKVSRMRRHFFATSSIQQLLVSASSLCTSDSAKNCMGSDNQIQSPSNKRSDLFVKVIKFALKACIDHLQSFSNIGTSSDMEPFKTLIYEDIKQLGKPIMRLIYLIKSQSDEQLGTKKKGLKCKKNVEEKEGVLFLALSSLKELLNVVSDRVRSNEFIAYLVCLADLDSAANYLGVCNEQHLVLGSVEANSVDLFFEKRLLPLLSELLALSLFRESEILIELILMIGKKLPYKQRHSYGTWAMSICKSMTIKDRNAARSVISLAIGLTSAPNDLTYACEIATSLLEVTGSDEKEPLEISEMFPIINHSTSSGVASLLITLMEPVITDLDWALLKLKAYFAQNYHVTNSYHKEASAAIQLEESIYSRSEALVLILSCFVEMNLKDSQAEQLLKIHVKFYKLLARMTKLRIAPKGCKQHLPSFQFQKLAEITCKKLTGPIYNFVAILQRNQQESANRKNVMSRIKKENRCIPDLIYQIEDYERYLIQLSKLTKVNLLRHAKRSIARDFKILLETERIISQEESASKDCTQDDSGPSDSDSNKEIVGQVENEMAVNSDDGSDDGDVAGASDKSEALDKSEDEEIVIEKKRAKMNKVVEDSDEEV